MKVALEERGGEERRAWDGLERVGKEEKKVSRKSICMKRLLGADARLFI